MKEGNAVQFTFIYAEYIQPPCAKLFSFYRLPQETQMRLMLLLCPFYRQGTEASKQGLPQSLQLRNARALDINQGLVHYGPLFVFGPHQIWYLYLQIVRKKSKEEQYLVTCKNHMKFRCQYPQIKIYWHTATLIYSCSVYGSFHAITSRVE